MPRARSSAFTACRAPAVTSTSWHGRWSNRTPESSRPTFPAAGAANGLPPATHYTDRAYTSAMGALIARLDVEQVDWIGTSLGGHIGMMLAAEQATPIRRLVLNDFGARVSASALRRIGATSTRSWKFESIDALEVHLRDALAPFGELSDAQWRELCAAQRRAGPIGRLSLPLRSGHRRALSRYRSGSISSSGTLWDKIECPVLILRGEDSDFLLVGHGGPDASAVARPPEAGKVTAIEIAGCGHAPALLDRGAGRRRSEISLSDGPST